MRFYSNVFLNPAWWKSWVTPDHFSYDEIPDLSGKVALVTGANTGLGYATTVALASRGAHVFLACRSKERAQAAIERAREEIQAKDPSVNPKLEFLELDLNDMNQCHRAAKEFLATGHPLHILINNAAIMDSPFALTVDGIEQQFGCNHMGHFVFTMALLDRIKESAPSRIVIVSALAHEEAVSGIDYETLNDETALDGWERYGRSKLANLFFGQELADRLANEEVFVNIVHPGIVKTELARHMVEKGVKFSPVTNIVLLTPQRGALTQLYAATSPEIAEKNIRGKYFMPVANQIRPNPITTNKSLQKQLWDFSVELMQQKVKVQ